MTDRSLHEQKDMDLVVAFRSKNRFINLIFMNTNISKVTYKKTIFFFIVICFVFIGIPYYSLGLSIFFFVENAKVIQYQKRYYEPNSLLCSTCEIQVEETMLAPVYVMYQLGNFYQNHRRYIQSKSNYQLAGNVLDDSQAKACTPKITNKDMNKNLSWGNVTLDPDAIASPCGYIAYTYFNDTYSLFNPSGVQVQIDETGISWPGDQGEKYRRAENSSQYQWIDPENEHFIVWMRTSGIPNFKKLWGKINQDLSPGTYRLDISNLYDSSSWDGSRTFLLTTKSSVGGRNYWLPSSFLIIGLLCLGAVIFFWRRMSEFKRLHSNELE